MNVYSVPPAIPSMALKPHCSLPMPCCSPQAASASISHLFTPPHPLFWWTQGSLELQGLCEDGSFKSHVESKSEHDSLLSCPFYLKSIPSQTSCLIATSVIKWTGDTVLSPVIPNQLSSTLLFFLFPEDKDWNSGLKVCPPKSQICFSVFLLAHHCLSSYKDTMVASQTAMPYRWISFEIGFWWQGNKIKYVKFPITSNSNRPGVNQQHPWAKSTPCLSYRKNLTGTKPPLLVFILPLAILQDSSIKWLQQSLAGPQCLSGPLQKKITDQRKTRYR